MSRPRVRVFVMGVNRWREEHEWPPARPTGSFTIHARRLVVLQEAVQTDYHAPVRPSHELLPVLR